jgi:Terminase small subunit
MPILSNAKDELFCQGVASGLSKSEAYRRATGRIKNADTLSAQFLVKIGIKERIAELTAESSKKCRLSREALIASLEDMYKAKPSEASMEDSRCDVLITRGQKHAVFPPKLAIAAQLSKLAGYDRPLEVRVEAGSELTSFLGRLFTRNPTLGGVNGERNKASEAAASVRH